MLLQPYGRAYVSYKYHTNDRQTKLWFPLINLLLSKKILQLDRIELGRLIRWITGHNFLRRHQNLLDPDNYVTDLCRLCGTCPETAEHILTQCVTLDHTRKHCMNVPYMEPPYKWSLEGLRNLLSLIADKMEASTGVSNLDIFDKDGAIRTVFLDSTAQVPRDSSSDIE